MRNFGANPPHTAAAYLIAIVGQLYARIGAREMRPCASHVRSRSDTNIVTPMLVRNLRDEIDATLARDPAARSRAEVVLCYLGFQAPPYYRAAHWIRDHGWRLAGPFGLHLRGGA